MVMEYVYHEGGGGNETLSKNINDELSCRYNCLSYYHILLLCYLAADAMAMFLLFNIAISSRSS